MTLVRVGILMENIRATGACIKHETHVLPHQARYIYTMTSYAHLDQGKAALKPCHPSQHYKVRDLVRRRPLVRYLSHIYPPMKRKPSPTMQTNIHMIIYTLNRKNVLFQRSIPVDGVHIIQMIILTALFSLVGQFE